MKKRLLTFLVAAIVLAAVALLVVRNTIYQQNLPPAERGLRVAQREGCFACHGPGGTRGIANPGRPDPVVPNFEADVMMYARDPEQIRQWIENGVSDARKDSDTWLQEKERGALVMPAFKDKLTSGEIDDLVAFIMATSKKEVPNDAIAARGMKRAAEFGCFGCHGPGGRLAPPNPGSLKGYIPSWDGADFPELVHDEDEFRQWVENGISDRFDKSTFARNYLKRANIKMPPYKKHLEPDDVDAMWAYVQWLRSGEE